MVATIFPADRDDARTLARALLDAAGPERHGEVATVTQGALGIAYEVPDDLADAVLGTGEQVEGRAVVRPGEAPAEAEAGGSDADVGGGSRRPAKASRARAGGGS
ncbi:hypothetical protein Ait01nite_020190 [Actinoplanes italicus]|uniref:Uncharacterized protein n=1 Tax=Actinoplanes italicus TaxID=113567 RepID=A0A2T0KPB3_9ACTN|nr:hypothetical protein [Actinoplanes italicus]PRX25582.1 hypothetical protein CLV67_101299 [Actinoplanes italicus]GIE28974.1 hypothetical protein Ait01nite_020190 [Actinoplanes italicus]